MAYTTTPVTLTYSQMGRVQRAMRRCASMRCARPRRRVTIASTGTAAAKTSCFAFPARTSF